MQTMRNRTIGFIPGLIWVICCIHIISCSKETGPPGQDYWPTKGWREATPEEHGMKSGKLADMLGFVRANQHGVESILICRNGYLVLDAYVYPFQKNTRHILHSCTKSVTSALIGVAVEQGHLQGIDQSVLDFFPDITPANMSEDKKKITLEHLLMMAPGLECRDSWQYHWRGLRAMRQSPDWSRYMLGLPMAEPSGKRFEYCNGASFLLSAVLQQATGMKTIAFANQNLFIPLGISDVKWQANPRGITIGWGELWLKPREMAKFGLLYLNQGQWGDKQLVPESWIKASTRRHLKANVFDGYGYHWWVDSTGYYMAVGYLGQFIFVIPDRRMVVVFTSNLEGPSFFIPKRLLDDYIIPAAVSSESLPADPDQTARLRAKVKECSEAPPSGYTWFSEKEGRARGGVFVRTASPAFRFNYPDKSRRFEISAPGMIMTMKTPRGMRFSSAVMDIPEGMKLSEMGPGHYAQGLSRIATHIEVISNKAIKLPDGSPAYRTDIKWRYQGVFPVTTLLTSAFKDGKCVYVSAHPREYNWAAERIVSSLTFN